MADQDPTRDELEALVKVARGREKTARNHLNAAIEANRQSPAQGDTLEARRTEDRLRREYRQKQRQRKSAELELETHDRVEARKRQKAKSLEKEIGKEAERARGKTGFRRRGRDDDAGR